MTLAEKIKKLRTDKGWSQQQLADHLGLQRTTITQYESGRIAPSSEVFKKLSGMFSITVDMLMDDRISLTADTLQTVGGIQNDGTYVDTLLKISAKRLVDEIASDATSVFAIDPTLSYRFIESLLQLNYIAQKNKQEGIQINRKAAEKTVEKINEHMRVLIDQVLMMEKTYEMFKAK